MKNIVIVLAMAIVCAIAGLLLGTASVNVPADMASIKPHSTGDQMHDEAEALRHFGEGAAVMSEGTKRGNIGAGVGLVFGVVAGFGITAVLGKKK